MQFTRNRRIEVNFTLEHYAAGEFTLSLPSVFVDSVDSLANSEQCSLEDGAVRQTICFASSRTFQHCSARSW